MTITRIKTKYANDVFAAVKANGGYCPCKLIKDDDSRCICKAFLECETTGECECGLYYKVEV